MKGLCAYFLVGSSVLLLGGCSSSGSSSSTAASAPTDSVSATVSVEVTTTVVIETVTPASAMPLPTTPPTTPPGTSPPVTAPIVAPCATSALALEIGGGDGAAGSSYTPLIFTNTGSVTCSLDGHPGVSFVDSAGNQIGPSAERTGGNTPTVVLAPGERAHATMQSHNAGLFGDDCAPVRVSRMKVYPPDQTAAIIVDFGLDVCTGPITGAQFIINVVSPGISD